MNFFQRGAQIFVLKKLSQRGGAPPRKKVF